MSEIKKLDPRLSSRIAAGEVIERPQSVARELIDNAIDAHADEIALSLTGGGIDELVVTDNGKGIMKEDLPAAVLQYATSKISEPDDLYHIHTMGFRGEALHSVAAVSRLTISSSYKGESPWTLCVDNNEVFPLTPGGPDRGTIVKVENLFSQIKARRSFLKRPSSEANLCRNMLLSKAMAFPEIHFTFIQDGAIRADLPKRSTLFDRVMDILTLDESFSRKDFIYLEKECADFSIRLVTSLPGIHRSDRSRIKVYVNSRAVDEYSLVQSVVYGYGEILPGGAFPYSVLFIDDNPELVDFNIHPAKKEVRLRNKAEIHHEVHTLIHSSLPRQIPTIVKKDEQAWLEPVARSTTSWTDADFTRDSIRHDTFTDHRKRTDESVSEKPSDPQWLEKAKELFTKKREAKGEPVYEKTAVRQEDFWKPDEKTDFTYLGQAFRLFLVCTKGDDLYLVDQHAAHDTQYGISLAQKDDRLWELTSIPHSAKENEDRLVSFIKNAVGSEDEIEAGLYSLVACRGAIKAGDFVDDITAKALLEKVFSLEDPVCPHGRTFVIRISQKELRQMVGRTV